MKMTQVPSTFNIPLTQKQGAVLLQILMRIGGEPRGGRGVADQIMGLIMSNMHLPSPDGHKGCEGMGFQGSIMIDDGTKN